MKTAYNIATYQQVAEMKPGSRVLVVQHRSEAYGGARLFRATLRRVTKTRVIVDVIMPGGEKPHEVRFLFNPKGYRDQLDRIEGETVWSNSSWVVVAPESNEAVVAHFQEQHRRYQLARAVAAVAKDVERLAGALLRRNDPDLVRAELRTELMGALARLEAM